jgi:solute carrier family 35 protein E1
MSVVGAIMLLPIAAAAEGRHLIGGNNALSAASARFAESGATLFGVATPFVAYALVSAVLFHLYNQTSYQALALLSPLDISVANAVKRVVIILASFAAFRNPITPLGAAAAAVAVAGTFLYTLAAQKQRNEERGGGEDE